MEFAMNEWMNCPWMTCNGAVEDSQVTHDSTARKHRVLMQSFSRQLASVSQRFSIAQLERSLNTRPGFEKGLAGDETTQHYPGLQARFSLQKSPVQLVSVSLQHHWMRCKPQDSSACPITWTQVSSPDAITVCGSPRKVSILVKIDSRSQSQMEIRCGLFLHTPRKAQTSVSRKGCEVHCGPWFIIEQFWLLWWWVLSEGNCRGNQGGYWSQQTAW